MSSLSPGKKSVLYIVEVLLQIVLLAGSNSLGGCIQAVPNFCYEGCNAMSNVSCSCLRLFLHVQKYTLIILENTISVLWHWLIVFSLFYINRWVNLTESLRGHEGINIPLICEGTQIICKASQTYCERTQIICEPCKWFAFPHKLTEFFLFPHVPLGTP